MRKGAPKRARTRHRQHFFFFFFLNNKNGSSRQCGLTWDVDVPSFMIGEFTPVPLSRRNVRLFNQKGPRHAQSTQSPFERKRCAGKAAVATESHVKSDQKKKQETERKNWKVGPLFSFFLLFAPFFSFRKPRPAFSPPSSTPFLSTRFVFEL